jgi:hypothetical protein
MWRFSGSDQALTLIYQAHELRRDDEVAMALWRKRHEQEHAGSG